MYLTCITLVVHCYIILIDIILCKINVQQESGRFWPGLGGTDTHYAWVYASGQLIGILCVPVTAVMTHHLPFSVAMLISLAFFLLGGIVYGLTVELWMAFFALILRGIGAATGPSVMHTYIGEMGTKMDDIRIRQNKKPRKYLLYIIYSFIFNGTPLITYG